MPEYDDDGMSDILLDEYEATADKLARGEPVSADTMTRYQGMTGKMMARAMRKLWTKRDLEDHIDKRLDQRCASCEKSSGTTWANAVKANIVKLAVCLTVIISLAIVFNRLQQLRDFFADVTPRVSQIGQ